MSIGPLESFIFPSVIVQTNLESSEATASGDIRIPAIIGTSSEETRVSNFEMVRGSSAMADNIILDELVVNQTGSPWAGPGWIDGDQGDALVKSFRVENLPIVKGDGTGRAATLPSNVIVTVDSEPVAVGSVNGLTGVVTLVQVPDVDAEVRVNYYFKRRDTYIEGEDLSAQAVAGTATTFKVNNARIVKGDNGGTSATDSDIGVTVDILYDPTPSNPGDEYERTVSVLSVTDDGDEATVTEIDGANGTFTLSAAPAAGSEVLVTYFTNAHQNTYDILPAPVINRLVKVGLSQDTNDYSIGTDCVLTNSNRINWGQTSTIEAGVYTTGSTAFESRVIATVADTKTYGRVGDPVRYKVDGSGNPVLNALGDGFKVNFTGNKVFTLPSTPVDGTGNNVPTEDVSKVTAYVGTTWAAAYAAPAVTVTSIDGSNITLATAPSEVLEEIVFVSYYENILVDDTWTITNALPGAVNVGKYYITSTQHGRGMNTTLYTGGGGLTPALADYPSSVYNFEVDPLKAQVERVRLTFDVLGNFTVTSLVGTGFTVAGKTGSVTTYNQNKGHVGKTYIDPTTGFRVTFVATYAPGVNKVEYNVGDPTTSTTPNKYYITASASIVRVVPGVNLVVDSTDGVAADNTGDTVILTTYNASGNEPSVGDFYYVTYDRAKTNYAMQYLTNMRDVVKLYGPIDINNRITVAANLMFINGARGVAIQQVLKTTGGTDASVASYIAGIDTFNEPMRSGLRPSLIQPLSTNSEVHSYLKTSNAIQSSIRYRNERTSIIGFALGTSSDEVIQRVKNLNTEKLTAVYPDGAIIGITDVYGNEVEYAVDGSIVAAAVAGRDVSTVTDMATTLTNSTVVGFKRLYRRLDNVTASLVANAGCTVLEEQTPVIRVLMYLTTDLSSSLTRDPRIVEMKHFIQQGVRRVLTRYIGAKNLPKVQPQVKDTLGSYFKSLKKSELIVDYTGINVKQNETDPSTLDVEAYYSPVYPVNWIVVTLNLRSSLS